MFVPRRRAVGVDADDGSVEVELLAKMGDDPFRHGFARPDDAAGIAERAKLQRKAEPIMGPPPSSDVPQLFWRQGVVADDLSLAFGQGEHGVEPSPVDDGAPRHGVICPN